MINKGLMSSNSVEWATPFPSMVVVYEKIA